MLYSNKDLRKLIIPIVLEQMLSMLVGMVDTIMISTVGEAAVSGISLVDTINFMIINIFVAFGTGGAVVAGHYLGQKDSENAGKAAWQVNLFSSMVAILVTIIFIVFHNNLLNLIFGKVDEAVMSNARPYLIVTAVSITPLAIYNACAALFRIMGDSKTTLKISIMMNIMNVTGNAILIYGAKMGAAGAALSTTIARTTAAIVIFTLMMQSKRIINFKGKIVFRFQFHLIKKILFIGVPNALEGSMFQLGKIMVLSMVSAYGTYTIAANAVCNGLAGFATLPGVAVGNALLAISSVCVGAGKMEQVRYYTKKLILLATLFMTVTSAIMILGAPFFVGLYHLSAEAEALAIKVLTYHNLMAILFWAPSFALPNVFRAAGDVVRPMIIAIFSMWVFRLLMSYVLGSVMGMGLFGVWIAMTIDWIFRGICYLWRYKGNKWEQYIYRNEI